MGKMSVIVPVYNAEEHIKDSIGSILKQSYTNFELLLVNDGIQIIH
jgi:glycosyltransferase involved in cell wall biosynthesis